MKTTTSSILLAVIATLAAGCGTIRVYDCSVDGNRVIQRERYEVKLSVVRIVQQGNTFSFPEDLVGADGFLFTFVGTTNDVKLDSIIGSYQYKKKRMQPLELRYSTSSNAALVVPDQQKYQFGHLQAGPYSLEIKNTIDGQAETNDFRIDYKVNYKTKWVFWWDLIGIDPI
jgi:hypothetical protein